MGQEKITSKTNNSVFRREFEFRFLKEEREDIEEWYERILSANYSYEYVVFVTQRTYKLALMMEKVTGKNLPKNYFSYFSTDEAICANVKEIIERYYEKMEWPCMLLCFDVMYDGTDVNEFYDQFMVRILEQIELEGKMDDFKDDCEKSSFQKFALFDKCQINTVRFNKFSKVKLGLNLRGAILGSIDEVVKWNNTTNCNELLYKINKFLSRNGDSDVYRFSEYISEEEFKKINLENYIKTRYKKKTQYTLVEYVADSNEIKAILTLRIIKCEDIHLYRVVPLVILHNLSEEETNSLIDILLEKMEGTEFDENDKDYIQKLEKKVGAKSILSELIVLFFSQVLLQEFNLVNNIVTNENDYQEEILKMTRAYDVYGLINTQKLLKKVIKERLFTVDELKIVLENAIPSKRGICKIQNGESCIVNQQEIIERLEKYFYRIISKEEKHLVDVEKEYEEYKRLSALDICWKSSIVIFGGTVLRLINEGNTEIEFFYTIAILLQMVDYGMVSITSLGPCLYRDVGFVQYLRVEKQTLLVYPLEMMEYIPMLSEMELMEYASNNLRDEFIKFSRSSKCNLEHTEINKILEFINHMDSMGQTANEWNGNYEGDCFEDWKQIGLLIDKQNKHRDDYKKYLYS